MFTLVKDAVLWIETIKRFSPRNDLSRMRKALSMVNNPQLSYRKIHVGGTNGKGSTASTLRYMLMAQGYKVGIFTSPYIVSFNERITINDTPITDEALIRLANRVHAVCEQILKEDDDIVTFFEVVTLIGFLYFQEQAVDFAVVEVGLGGLLDATNVIESDVAIITNIGYDHMQTLGNTLSEIAANKLGIVKKGNHLITTVDVTLHDQFKKHCKQVGASVTFITPDALHLIEADKTTFVYKQETYTSPLLGVHQAFNGALALETMRYLFPSISAKTLQEGFNNTKWPGRMECVMTSPHVILDGAHNINGIEALVTSLKTLYKNKHKHVIFCAMQDKETDKMIHAVETIADKITFTHFDYYRVMELNQLYEQSHHANRHANPDYVACIQEAIKSAKDDEMVIVTGSLYFISAARKLFNV